jgi:hypothetical protein
VAHRRENSTAASLGTAKTSVELSLRMEDSIYTSHSRTLVPLAPSPNVTAALRSSLAALGGSAAMARIGLSASASLFELNVLVSLPGAAAQPPHVDQLPRPGLSMGTIFLALQDTTADMGATVLFPAPPCEVAVRCDWNAIRRQAGSAVAFGESFDPSGESDSAAEALVRHMQAEAEAEGQSLERAAPSPWWQHSAAKLGLGAPVAMELGAGDAMLVDYRQLEAARPALRHVRRRSRPRACVTYVILIGPRDVGEGIPLAGLSLYRRVNVVQRAQGLAAGAALTTWR